MAAHIMELCLPHGRVFFIYDGSVVCKEEDDPKDAIVIFFPPNVSDDDQCALCGQLIGTIRFITLALGSSPKLVRLKHDKFAVKIIGQYTMLMCGSHDDADSAVISQLDTLCNMLLFYHGGLSLMTASYNRKEFVHHIRTVMESYLPFSRCYGDTLSSAFTLVPEVDLPKSETEVFLSASNILQTCHRQPFVLAGAVLNNQRVVCSQLPNEITSQLLIIKAHQTHLPCKHIDTAFPLPDGVRLIDVYLKSVYSTKLRRDESQRMNTQKQYAPSKFKLNKSNLKSPAVSNIIQKQMINKDLVDLESDVSIQDSSVERTISPCVTLDTERSALDTLEDPSQLLNSAMVRTVSTLTDSVPDAGSDNKENIYISDSENQSKDTDSIDMKENHKNIVKESVVLGSLENVRDDTKDKCLISDFSNNRSDNLSSDISYKVDDDVSDKDAIQIPISIDTVMTQTESTSALTLNERSDRDVIDNKIADEVPSLAAIAQANVSACVSSVIENKQKECSQTDKPLQCADNTIPGHDLEQDSPRETRSDESLDELLSQPTKDKSDLEVETNTLSAIDKNLCEDIDSDKTNPGKLTQANDVIDDNISDETCDTKIEKCASDAIVAKGADDASDAIVVKNVDDAIDVIVVKSVYDASDAIVVKSVDEASDAIVVKSVDDAIDVIVVNSADDASDVIVQSANDTEKCNGASISLSSKLNENTEDRGSLNGENHQANEVMANFDEAKDDIGGDVDEIETARTDKGVDNMCRVTPHTDKDKKNGMIIDPNEEKLCELENTLYSYEQCVYKNEGGIHKKSSIYNVALEVVAKDYSHRGYVHKYDGKHHSDDAASPRINDSSDSRESHDTTSAGLPDDTGQSSSHHYGNVKVNMQVKKEKRVTIIEALEENSSESAHRQNLTDPDAAITSLDVLANEDLEQFTLYIQGHSETLLILLMENEARDHSTTINSLWQTALPQLGDLDYRVKECQQISDKQKSSHGYNFLHFDGYQHTMKGSIHEAVTAGENEFFRLATRLHQDFTNKGLSDVTAKSHGAAIYAHQAAGHETYFQTLAFQRNLSGLPFPKDPIFTAEDLAHTKLSKEQGITLL